MSTIPEQLEEGVYRWVFGEGESDDDDPGLLVTEGKSVPGFLAWLGDLEKQIGALKQTLGKGTSESAALTRLRALKAEIERAQPIVFMAKVDDVGQPVVSMDAFRQRTRRRVLIAGSILALAAIVFLVVRPSSKDTSHDVSAELATIITRDIVANSGFGFGGAVEPSAHDRGFLLGAVIDLSKPRGNGVAPGPAELDLARKLATFAQSGLDAPEDAEQRRIRALGGCSAILGDDPDRNDCERGLISYLTSRDNVLH